MIRGRVGGRKRLYCGVVNVNAATAGLAALIGLGTGVSGALAFRFSERERVGPPEPPNDDPVPPGVAAVLQVLRSSAVVLDASDAVVKASPAGYAMGLVKARSLTSPELLELARQVRRDGEIRQVEMDLPHGANSMLHSTVRIAPLGATLVLVLVEDRTEARRVDEVRRDFVANVSHELKTPVGALSLLAEAVQSASDDPEAVRRFAARMQQEAHRLTALIQDLIDLSRVQIDAPLAASAQLVPVADVVADALDRSYEAASSRRIELIADVEEDVMVRGDRTQLAAALGNLVENGVNYSPEQTRVAVTVKLVGELVEIAVTDQGIGIPERDLERIFERFYRVDPARSRATGGTGLGLSIVKHIAATHGGEVTVWSSEGNGSTFTLKLPVHAGQRDLAAAS
ncbi:MAG: two-component sensor histidine kinase [Catenulisporales bacterium]|nr:two-component sensor histidine kinase [Catenulisporales bacterium]